MSDCAGVLLLTFHQLFIYVVVKLIIGPHFFLQLLVNQFDIYLASLPIRVAKSLNDCTSHFQIGSFVPIRDHPGKKNPLAENIIKKSLLAYDESSILVILVSV